MSTPLTANPFGTAWSAATAGPKVDWVSLAYALCACLVLVVAALWLVKKYDIGGYGEAAGQYKGQILSYAEGMTPGAVNVSDVKVGLNSWAAGGGSAGAEGADTQFLTQRTPTLSGNVSPGSGASCPAGWTAGARDELAALSTVGTYTDAELSAALGGR